MDIDTISFSDCNENVGIVGITDRDVVTELILLWEYSMYLSKSSYVKGVQCPKMLWMQRWMPEQFDSSVMNQNILTQGSEVGDLAMGYFGSYVEVDFDPHDPDRFNKAIQQTEDYLSQGYPIVCEATFSYEGNYCMVDILRMREDGTCDLVEVKSSTKMMPIYLEDMAYQCWVVQHCGYEVNSISLMHINSEYVRMGSLNVQQLFAVEDHTEEVLARSRMVPKCIENMLEIAEADSEPLLPIGPHCFNPYECGFRSWCFQELPENNVFDLVRIRKDKATRLIEKGLAGFQELANDVDTFNTLTEKQQTQILAELDLIPDHIDIEKIQEFLSTLWYPLYFLDFETFQEAIPSFDREKPYEQITSQYSLHWINEKDGELHHTEFLGDAGVDPRRQLAEQLCQDIPHEACVLAWNMGFEKGRIKSLAQLLPDLSENLLAIYDNIRDLMTPFQQGWYYTKEMRGSFSIKYVLPALFPNSQELDYHALEGVHNGTEAATTFQSLARFSPEELLIKREQLLRYCELDTLAMVRIWQYLIRLVASDY